MRCQNKICLEVVEAALEVEEDFGEEDLAAADFVVAQVVFVEAAIMEVEGGDLLEEQVLQE